MSLPRPCCLNPLIIPGTPRGSLAYFDKEEKSIKWYHAKPTRVQREDTALVLFYDVFGFNLPNPKILADEFAQRLGVNVYVPNYLPSPPRIEAFAPIVELYPNQLALEGQSPLKTALLTAYAYVSALPRLVSVLDWFAYPKALRAVNELRQLHPHLGVLGYCRGGAIVVRLLSEQTPSITSGMICHPGPVNMKDWDTIAKPSKWHLAAVDSFMKTEQIARLEVLEGDPLRSMAHMVHKETTHGFGSRPNTDHAPSKAAFEEVKADVEAFFTRTW